MCQQLAVYSCQPTRTNPSTAEHQVTKISISDKRRSVIRLVNRLEGVLVVREATTEERGEAS